MRLFWYLFLFFSCYLFLLPQSGRGQINAEFPNKVRTDAGQVDKIIRSAILLQNQQRGDSALLSLVEALRQGRYITYIDGMNSAMALITKCIRDLDYGPFYGNLLKQSVAYVENMPVNPRLHALLITQYGTYVHKEGRFSIAQRQFKNALNLLEKDTSLVADRMRMDLYSKIAIACIHFNKIDQAYKWLNALNEIKSLQKDSVAFFRSYVIKGLHHYRRKNADSAFHYYSKAYTLGKILAESDAIPWINLVSVITYYDMILVELNRPDQALKMFDSDQKLLEEKITQKQEEGYNEVNLKGILMECYLVKGYAYYKKKDYRKAEIQALALLDSATRFNLKTSNGDIYMLLAMVYSAQEKFEKAYQYQKLHSQFVYSIKETTESSAMAEQFEAEKNQAVAAKQFLIKEQEGKLQEKDILITSISIFLASILTISFFIWKNYKHKQRLLSSYAQNRYQEEEINRLQARMEGEKYERQRIAHELHDGIVSQLLALHLNINALQRKDEKMIPTSKLNRIAAQIKEATDDLRQTAHNLMPDLLLEQGLCLSLAALCEKTAMNTALEVDFQTYGSMPKLLPEVELNIYRMVQELLQNALKHAQATQIIVQLGCNDDFLNITVEDDGKGYLVEQEDPMKQKGMGIKNLRQRVQALRGHLDIKSTSHMGTTVYIEFNQKNLVHEMTHKL